MKLDKLNGISLYGISQVLVLFSFFFLAVLGFELMALYLLGRQAGTL
jgi:hypothetical protein